MSSDNDAESASSSSSSDCPGRSGLAGKQPNRAAVTRSTARATAATGKGILVHNNKKSANTNRVSFVASSTSASRSPSSSASSTPSPQSKRSKDRPHRGGRQQKQQQQQQQRRPSDAADQASYHTRTGRRLTGFGIKSYLHDFYDVPDDRRELFQDKEDGDDFRYSVEPTEIRWRRHCCGVYAALGLAVTAMGLMAMAAGHLIPAQDPFAGRSAAAAAAANDRDVEAVVADRAAVQFNELLASCRYVGSVMFAAGVVFTVVRFWVSVIRAAGDRKHAAAAAEDDDRRLAEAVGDHLKRAYADRRRSSLHQHQQQQPLPALPHRQAATVRIPVTGSVENVQPDPRAIHLRFDRSS